MSAVLAIPEDPKHGADAVNLLAVIQRAASDPAVDVDKFERLLSIRERIEARDAEMEFNAAMVSAQSSIRTIGTDRRNDQTKSNYATYEKLDRVLRPVYVQNGFSLSFDTEASGDASVRVLCRVAHRAGHSHTYSIVMPADGKGAKGGDVMTKTHATGSAVSYGMRYLLKMIFNVAVGEEDDDGNGADGYDATSWYDAIDGAVDMTELNRIAAELKGNRSVPAPALRSIRAAWSKRAKELKS